MPKENLGKGQVGAVVEVLGEGVFYLNLLTAWAGHLACCPLKKKICCF